MSFGFVPLPVISLSGIELPLKVWTTSITSTFVSHKLTVVITVDGIEYEQSLPVINETTRRYAIFDLSFALKQTNSFNHCSPYPLNYVFTNIATKPFSVAVKESYYNSATGTWTTSGETTIINNYKALDGGISRKMMTILGLKSTTFHKYYIEGLKWLSVMPVTQTISENHPICLYFGIHGGGGTRSVTFNITTSDTDGLETVNTNTISITGFDIINQILVSPIIMYNDFSLTGVMKSIEIFFTINSVNSESRFFNIEGETSQSRKFLMFKNSFGVFDSIEITGEDIIEHEGTNPTFAVNATDRTTGKFYLEQVRANISKITKTDCGFIQSPDILFLTDLINSTEIYLLKDSAFLGHFSERVVLLNDTVTFKDNITNDSLYNFPISYTAAFMEKFYSQDDTLWVVEPPFFNYLSDYFVNLELDEIEGRITGNKATITTHGTYGTMITFPIADNSHFDFSDEVYWSSAVTSLPWYSALAPSTCPISFLTEANINTHATTYFKNRVYMNTYTSGTNASQLLPICMYYFMPSEIPTRFQLAMLYYLLIMSPL